MRDADYIAVLGGSVVIATGEPATTIQYALPQAANVTLTVYNVVGQPVRTLIAEHQSTGRYLVEWDATDDSGHSLSSGLYFYRLQAGGAFHAVQKMLLLK